MEWFMLTAPVPDVVELATGGAAAVVVALVAACAPLVLVVRHALRADRVADEAPRLRMVVGRKELERHAA